MVDLDELKARALPISEHTSINTLNLLAAIAISERLEALQKTLERLSVAVDTISLDLSARKNLD